MMEKARKFVTLIIVVLFPWPVDYIWLNNLPNDSLGKSLIIALSIGFTIADEALAIWGFLTWFR